MNNNDLHDADGKAITGGAMRKIECPKCHTVFEMDGSGYAAIVQQIRTKEFDKEIQEKLATWEKEKNAEIAIAKAETEKTNNEALSKKDSEISELKAKLSEADTAKRLAIIEALEKQKQELNEARAKIVELEGTIRTSDAEHELAIKNKDNYIKDQERMYEERIASYKDMRLKLSTKMLGETLEQHCQNSFNQIRSTAFQTAYFEKDNEVSKESGSKGDYIFRDFVDGVETVSIMFDMKNESDTTATKKTNESFLKELDKDRREKHCEYAVLVSLLEQDNELYNNGIVDMSYRYPKMYVIRPQFFIPLISILVNEARKNAEVKQQLIAAQNKNIDITNFESDLENFKSGFLKFMTYAGNNFDEAEKRITACRDSLNNVLDNFQTMRKHLNAANNKLEDLTIKKLTKNRPFLQELFADSAQ